jgi:hypothetical protein
LRFGGDGGVDFPSTAVAGQLARNKTLVMVKQQLSELTKSLL